jgi:hypothetical protein
LALALKKNLEFSNSFLHSMGREREVAFCETRDLLFDKNVLHISPKPDKGFRLKGKRSRQATKGRKVPMPTAFMASMKKHCEGRGEKGRARKLAGMGAAPFQENRSNSPS